MTDKNLSQICSSVAVLYATFTSEDGGVFTASMSASSQGSTTCDAQDNAQKNVENLLKNIIAEHIPRIVNHEYHIKYTNKRGDLIDPNLCYTKEDGFIVKTRAYRLVKGYTVTPPTISVGTSSTSILNTVQYYSDSDCTQQVGYGSCNLNPYSESNNAHDDVSSEFSSGFNFSNIFNEKLDCIIHNIKTHQQINAFITPNHVQGVGISDAKVNQFNNYNKTQAIISTVGSTLSENGFGITSVDGWYGTSENVMTDDILLKLHKYISTARFIKSL